MLWVKQLEGPAFPWAFMSTRGLRSPGPRWKIGSPRHGSSPLTWTFPQEWGWLRGWPRPHPRDSPAWKQSRGSQQRWRGGPGLESHHQRTLRWCYKWKPECDLSCRLQLLIVRFNKCTYQDTWLSRSSVSVSFWRHLVMIWSLFSLDMYLLKLQ